MSSSFLSFIGRNAKTLIKTLTNLKKNLIFALPDAYFALLDAYFALLDAHITYMILDVHLVGLKVTINSVHEKCQEK